MENNDVSSVKNELEERPQAEKKPSTGKKKWIILAGVAAVVLIVAAVLVAVWQGKEQEYSLELDLGYRYLAEGNYEQAIIAFEAAIEIMPRRPAPYVGCGDAYTGLEAFADAQGAYTQALELEGAGAEAYLGLANAYIELGDPDSAVEALESGAQATGDPRLEQWLEALRGLSGTGALSGTVSEYLAGGGTAFLPGARVRIYLSVDETPRLARVAVTDGAGSFSFAGLAQGAYVLHVDAPDHIGLETVEQIEEGIESYTELFLLIPETDRVLRGEEGALFATVTNAIDGSRVPYAQIAVRSGWNNRDGATIPGGETQSDEEGLVQVSDLAYGYYTVETQAEDFTPAYHNVAVLPEEFYAQWDLPISPVLGDGETRIILTWNEEPLDLDSHLDSDDFRISYASQDYYDGAGEHRVNLDLDDQHSYGPETITIYAGVRDSCTYSVHDYSNGGDPSSMGLSNSGATVRVYQESGLVATFHVPTGIAGDGWTVFQIDADGQLTPINTVGMYDW